MPEENVKILHTSNIGLLCSRFVFPRVAFLKKKIAYVNIAVQRCDKVILVYSKFSVIFAVYESFLSG
jgi:hypothetical protein